MGWIQYPTKATIAEGLRAADPAAARAAKALADLMISQLERLDDSRAVAGMVYSALRRAATDAAARAGAGESGVSGGKGKEGASPKANKFDLLYLARVHGAAIVDLSVAMTVYIAREEERHPLKGADLEAFVAAAMTDLAGGA
ncbi:MAG: hypothetical protein AB7K52_12620 [Phycisphaerales bacterium]